ALRNLEARYPERQRSEVRGGRDVGHHRVRALQALPPGIDQGLVLGRIVIAEVEQDLAEAERSLAGRRPGPDGRALARNFRRAVEVGTRGKIPEKETRVVPARFHRCRDRQQGCDVPRARAQFPGEIDFRHCDTSPRNEEARLEGGCSGSRPYWTTHSMFEPALMLLVFSVCPKEGGGVTCGRCRGGGINFGGRLILLEKPTCPTTTTSSRPPATNAICPSATVTYTPGGGRSVG